MKSKKSFEMSFSWIFAFIAGGAILLLALYGMSKVIQTGQNLGQTEAAAALTALLDPLETGLASQKSEEIKLNADTAIFFTCSYLDNRPFGKQMIAFSEKNLNNKPGEKGRDISIKNKYIFSESVINGKNLYAFSVPFFLPFKIGDLIILSSKDYCFYQPPNEIKDEIENFELGNLKITKDLKNCSGTMVCFDSERDECDVKVFSNGGNYNNGKIVKNLQEVKYRDGLIYGAIFSSKEIYECNVKRLMARLSELTLIYSDKADTLNKKGCSSDIKLDLNVLKNNANSANSSRDLIDLDESAKKVDSFNKGIMQRCKLY
ncbi:hypothetical protein J4429_05035 [Candidatus Pacearchaeota archaeon]|nr:hypothetical protein [Candidatus Pacearchaeota archaeon]